MRKLALSFALSLVFAAAVHAQEAQGAPTAPVFMPSADMIRKNMKEAIAAGGANHDAVGLAGFIAKKAGL